MSRKRIWFGALGVVAVLAVVAALVVFAPWRSDDGDTTAPASPAETPEETPSVQAAEAFAKAWEEGDLAKVAYTPGSGDVAAITTLVVAGLTTDEDPRPVVNITGTAPAAPGERGAGTTTSTTSGSDGSRERASATLTWTLDGDRQWRYETSFDLVRSGETWLVDWRPKVIEPSLDEGELLQTARLGAARGRILDTAGTLLRGAGGAVTIGIKPSRADDPEATARTVAKLTAVDEAELVARVAAANPEDFVEVTTLDRAAYDAIRGEIQPLPGTVFREEGAPDAVSPDYAKAVLGTSGTATDEIIEASEGRLAPGDETGLSGIEASQDEKLSGTPGLSVRATPTAAAEGATPRVLEDFPGVAGQDVTVTLDQRLQSIAELSVAGTGKPSALVAIRVSTGDVLAVANGPSGATGFNRAMIGHYPPGSTFKVAATYGLLQNGLTPDTVVDCPPTITVGKVFTNAGDEFFGPVPFRKDFADSCNTAFVGQASEITAQELTDAAAALGYRELDIGTPVFGGSVPLTDDPTEHAANMLGQGKVDASPFSVALASASVANGSSLVPRLIVDPAAPEPAPGEGLAPEPVSQLRSLMRSVVVEGTASGTGLVGVPGGEVSGKTGTAEFGTDSPPRTHAWFTGFQGDIAFAVLVEDSGFGSEVAAPVAATFLTAVAGG